MSDDGNYYDSGDDDYFDLLDNADPTPELADDLAERATYSPIWHESHVDELRNYFSDYEYWTDDYWDDDPKLLNKSTENGASAQVNRDGVKKPAKRGRKRKLSEARDRPLNSKEMQSLQATIKGTVWKANSPELEQDYSRGSDQPVALRLNDTIMQSAYNTQQGFGKGRRKKDESWANDLSLADMGLRTEKSISAQQNVSMDEDGQEVAEDVVDDADEVAIEAEGMLDGDEEASSLLAGKACSSEIEVSMASNNSQTAAKSEGEGQPAQKKRKFDTDVGINNEHVLPTPDASLPSEVSETATETENTTESQPTRRGRGRPKKSSSQAIVEQSQHEIEPDELQRASGRKRKASIDLSATASTASSRAKRVASDKAASKPNATSRQVETTRTTRSRKK